VERLMRHDAVAFGGRAKVGGSEAFSKVDLWYLGTINDWQDIVNHDSGLAIGEPTP
jgi:hypothetical protein